MYRIIVSRTSNAGVKKTVNFFKQFNKKGKVNNTAVKFRKKFA